MTRNKILFTIAPIAIVSAAILAVAIPGFLINEEPGGVTYNLLYDTKIEPLTNKVVVTEPNSNNGVFTMYKENGSGGKSNDFKILAFTDSHLDHKQDQCNYTLTMMVKNIMEVKPDFVVMAGDNITSTLNKPRAKQFCQIMEDLNVYWSCCFGNHEGNQPGLTRQEMAKLFASYPHCIMDATTKHTSDGTEVWGYGDTAINILNSDNKVAQTLFFLDTDPIMSKQDMEKYADQIQQFKDMGKAKQDEVEFYDYVKDSQITWYKEVNAKYNSINSTVISHIPLKDMEDDYINFYKDAHAYHTEWGVRPDQTYGAGKNLWPYTEVTDETYNDIKIIAGHRAEDMCYGPHDLIDAGGGHTTMYAAMKDTKQPHPAYFCGHDHQNNFTLEHKDGDQTIAMGYIQPACYSSNNYWSKGMLHWSPYNTNAWDKYHLIQGYTVMDYKLDDSNKNSPFDLANYTNYEEWDDGEGNAYYRDALKLVEANRGTYKPAWDNKKCESTYPNDPNDPLQQPINLI